MLEDSITSSPSKSNKSIHKVRWLRKNKHKQIYKSVQNHDNEKEHKQKILHELYEDSEEQSEDSDKETKNNTFIINKPSTIVKNYIPFELEKCLAMADRISANQDIPIKRSAFPETQGFLTCENLAEQNFTTFKNQESSFMITESELINCCHQAEKVLEDSSQDEKDLADVKIKVSTLNNELKLENSILQNLSKSPLNKEPTSPQLELELVNSILQDFSQSPITKEQTISNTSWQHTPEFRLRIKPIKTYSRKCLNQTRINLSKRLESITSEEEDGKSYCSSLSIQEDIAPLEGVSNPTVSATNTSQRLCENLINLTAFFTQNSPTNHNSLNDQQDQILQSSFANRERLMLSPNIPDLLQEILIQRSRNLRFRRKSYDSNEDFYGFSSPKSEKYNEIDLQLNNDNTLDETLLEQQNIKLLKDQDMDINPEVSDSESVQIDHQLEINVNNKNFTDWNEDDYQDVFACIDTDKILQQHNISKNQLTNLKSSNNVETSTKFVLNKSSTVITTDSTKQEQDPSLKFVDFKTASVKAMKSSGDAHILAAKILSRFPVSPVKSATNICDNVFKNKDTTNKAENIFENPDDDNEDEWNDDCDFFKNFRTPVSINENVSSTLKHNKEIVKEKFSYSNDFPSTSKMALKANMGFQTAAGKCVAISKKAQESVQKILQEFNTDIPANFNCDELIEMKTKIYTKTHNLQTNSKGIKDNRLQCYDKKCDNEKLVKYLGNSTNKLKNYEVKISENEKNSQSNVILNEIDSKNNFKSDLTGEEVFNKNDKTKNDLKFKYTKPKVLTVQSSNSSEILNTNMGFQTANGKQVKISKKGQKSVEKLLKEFKTNINDDVENDLLVLKQKLKKKNSHKTPQIFQEIANEKKYTELDQPGTSKSFTLTDKKEVEKHLSENNEDLANIIFSDWPLSNKLNNSISSNEKDEIKEISKISSKEEILNTNSNSQEQFQESPRNKNKYDSLNICDMEISKSTNIGFQTAKGNKVLISAKAQLAVNKLLQEFRSDLNKNNYENDLIILKSNIELKNKELKNVNKSYKLNTTREDKECGNIVLSEWPLSQNKNLTPKQLTAKRKLSIDNSDIPSPIETRSPPSKIINKELNTTKSLLPEDKIRSPLNSSPVKSIIARKNLLSLTKRRKNKRNLATIANQDDSSNHNEKIISKDSVEFKATPIKSSISIRNSKQTPATPNLQEFFSNAPQTSTPKVNKLAKSPQTPMDIDFKPITWDSNNDAIVNKSSSTLNQTTKLSDSSCSNVSFNSSNPSAKERIARLKMYGKAPAVSPIQIDTHNNCRPSGLKRTRSMLKKKDTN